MLAQPPLWFVIIAFLCAIGPLVLFHELGHYWVARWFGVGAEQFSIGFGREVAGWTDKRGTRWKIGWLPLGGYVRFVGDMNPASQPDPGVELAAEARARSFHLKPWWQRFLIVLAGPAANFILAIAIFAAFFLAFGMPNTPPVAGGIQAGSTAARIGLATGDRILSIAGQDTESFEDLRRIVSIRPNAEVVIRFEHDGDLRSAKARIGMEERKDEFGQRYPVGLLGVMPPERSFDRMSVVQAIPAAAVITAKITRSIVDVLGQIVTGERSVKELGGPIKIAKFSGEQLSLGASAFVSFAALISLNLAFINLLPIPALDGGHLAFYAAEAVRRKPVGARGQEMAFRAGVAMILALMLFVTVNDLLSLPIFGR